MLVVLTAAAVLSLFAGQALGGRAWAFGLTVAVASVPLALLVHGLFYGLCSAFAQLIGPEEVIARTSRGGVERSGPESSGASADVGVAEVTPSSP
ncbi:MAG TPA: hypothetical protein VEQ85_11605 [Lacipirellulaceae bacterium]|nr:hypothetical protein [Lacipirellulaceae bacterium]